MLYGVTLGGTVLAAVSEGADAKTEHSIRLLFTRTVVNGERRYWKSCRKAPAGCEERIKVFADYFDAAAEAHHVPPLLLVAIAWHESALNPAAEGKSHAEQGILQILPRKSAPRFVTDARFRARCLRKVGACQHDVVQYGAAILSRTLDECDTPLRAVAAYNTGSCDKITRYHSAVIRTWQELDAGTWKRRGASDA